MDTDFQFVDLETSSRPSMESLSKLQLSRMATASSSSAAAAAAPPPPQSSPSSPSSRTIIPIEDKPIRGKAAVYLMTAIVLLQLVKLCTFLYIVSVLVWNEVIGVSGQDFTIDIQEQVYLSISLLNVPISAGFACLGCSIFRGCRSVQLLTVTSIMETFIILYLLQLIVLLAAFIFIRLTPFEYVVLLVIIFYEGSVIIYVDWALVQVSLPSKYSVVARFAKQQQRNANGPVDIPLSTLTA